VLADAQAQLGEAGGDAVVGAEDLEKKKK